MNTPKLSRILLGAAALVLAAVFAVKLASGDNVITAGLWLAAAVFVGIIAAALKPHDDKARSSVIGSGIALVLSLMVLSFVTGQATAPAARTQEAAAPAAPTDELLSESPAVNDAQPAVTPQPTDSPIPTATPESTPTPTPTSKPTATPVPTPTPVPPPVWHQSGMYKVGQDIPAGEYFLKRDGSITAYFAILKDSSGTLDSIIANDNFDTFRYVKLKDGEYFEIKRAVFIEVENAPEDIIDEDDREEGIAPEGMYKIGRDLPAGEYKVICDDDMAYIEVAKDSRHKLSSIVSNDNFSSSRYIKVKNGQYLTVVRGHIVLH